MRAADIYALTDPRDGAIRYIGKANDAKTRFKGHLRAARCGKTPVYSWIRKLAGLGIVPGLLVLETSENWQEAERRLILSHCAAGAKLLNVAEGGEEPFCPTRVRAANGRAVAKSRDKRKWALLQKLGSGLRRGHVSEQTKEKMRQRPEVFGQFAAYL